MIDRAISSTVLAALMGHESSTITERRYVHRIDRQRTDEAVRQAMASSPFDALWWSGLSASLSFDAFGTTGARRLHCGKRGDQGESRMVKRKRRHLTRSWRA